MATAHILPDRRNQVKQAAKTTLLLTQEMLGHFDAIYHRVERLEQRLGR